MATTLVRNAAAGIAATALIVTGGTTTAPAAQGAPANAPGNTGSSNWTHRDWSSTQWHLRALGIDELHQRGIRGAGATIAILDSGFDTTHQDLAGQADEHFTVANGRIRLLPTDRNSDTTGHGTHVATIAAAADGNIGVVGVAPDARLLLGRVLGQPGSDIANITGALAHIAGRADVVNLSLGIETRWLTTAEHRRFCQAITDTTRAGTLVVVAAGNSRLVGNPAATPAGCRDAVTVTALDSGFTPSFFTSFDQNATVSAPGHEIVAAAAAGTLGDPFDRTANQTIAYSGTSMAAPIVTGVAALIKAAHPDWGPETIGDTLANTAVDAGPRGRDPLWGWGVINPGGALAPDDVTSAPVAWPSLTVNFDFPDESGAFTRNGTLHWNIEPARAGALPTEWQLTYVPVDERGRTGTPRTVTVDGDQVRGTVANAGAYGWLTLSATIDGTEVEVGPVAVRPHDENAPVLKRITARWGDDAELHVDWRLRRSLRPGEYLHTMQWYDFPHTIKPPVVDAVTLDTGGSDRGSAHLRVSSTGGRASERAWRHWIAGGHVLAVRLCRGPFMFTRPDCLQQNLTPKLPLQVHAAAAGPGTATVHVTVNPYRGSLCRDGRRGTRCAGRIATVSIWGGTYRAVLDANGQAALSARTPKRPRNAARVTVTIAGNSPVTTYAPVTGMAGKR